jgi:ParB family chromosome partitioning protein
MKSIEEISVASIDPNPQQPRKVFSSESLEDLARSVAKQGVLQPVLVRRKAARYELIVGERRWRASVQAGLQTIPALIADHPDERMLELALIENLQREDLGPLEIAQAYRLLMDQNRLTQEQVADLVGKKRSSVANYIRLLELPQEIKDSVQNDRLSMGHARAISGLDAPEAQRRLAHQAEEEHLSVREVEELVRRKRQPVAAPPAKAAAPSRGRVHLQAAAERLAEVLGTSVSVQGSERHGRIIVEYYSQDQLSSLLDRLERP